jgi:uncharacterized protein YndB with AHSA1/START domain
MTGTIKPAPVRKRLEVAADPALAFQVFTSSMGSWWPKSHSIGKKDRLADLVIEPRVGGRWYGVDDDGEECQWGDVLVWSPPTRLVLAWRISAEWRYDPNLLTEVEVKFLPSPSGTVVEFEHRLLENYGPMGEEMRKGVDGEGGWTGILALYKALADAGKL